MIDDLTMLANLPVVEMDAIERVRAERDKAAAAETMPAPKRKRRAPASEEKAARVTRRGQDPPALEPRTRKRR